MKKSQIAAQCYTLRDFMNTPGGVDRSFAKLRKIGFEAVQISGVGADPKDIKKYADLNGITICATHEGGNDLLKKTDAIIEKLDFYNCSHTAYPYPSEWLFIDYESTLDFARELDEVAVKFAAAGKTLSYHNHNIEFRKFAGQRILDIILENAPHVQAEIDTYWVQLGGCDPAGYVQKYAGREVIFHLKDCGVLHFDKTIMVPIGSGNLDWATILPTAESAGVQWFIIEQDTCHKDPFDSLQDSFNYLTGNFVK